MKAIARGLLRELNRRYPGQWAELKHQLAMFGGVYRVGTIEDVR